MLNGLKVINLPHNSWDAHPSEKISHSTESSATFFQKYEQHFFILQTCQRRLLVGFSELPYEQITQRWANNAECYRGKKAYLFLLETICGLKSRLLGENEIVSQFKEAYAQYLRNDFRNPYIMEVLEKLFKDCKEIRSQYLHEIGQYSYSGLAKKIISQRTKNDESSPVVILGSGQLGQDLIKVLNRKYELVVCARNEDKIKSILDQYPNSQISIHPWHQKDELVFTPKIVNTIGAENTTLFSQSFFQQWSKNRKSQRVFIDLGSPSVLEKGIDELEGLYRLNDIFKVGGQFNEDKSLKVEKAKDAINELSHRRVRSSAINFPFGWEDLQFA